MILGFCIVLADEDFTVPLQQNNIISQTLKG